MEPTEAYDLVAGMFNAVAAARLLALHDLSHGLVPILNVAKALPLSSSSRPMVFTD